MDDNANSLKRNREAPHAGDEAGNADPSHAPKRVKIDATPPAPAPPSLPPNPPPPSPPLPSPPQGNLPASSKFPNLFVITEERADATKFARGADAEPSWEFGNTKMIFFVDGSVKSTTVNGVSADKGGYGVIFKARVEKIVARSFRLDKVCASVTQPELLAITEALATGVCLAELQHNLRNVSGSLIQIFSDSKTSFNRIRRAINADYKVRQIEGIPTELEVINENSFVDAHTRPIMAEISKLLCRAANTNAVSRKFDGPDFPKSSSTILLEDKIAVEVENNWSYSRFKKRQTELQAKSRHGALTTAEQSLLLRMLAYGPPIHFGPVIPNFWKSKKSTVAGPGPVASPVAASQATPTTVSNQGVMANNEDNPLDVCGCILDLK
ncbi:hypothetical protein OQA88_5096 [Cercophora sp. LCS_1]